MPATPAIKPAYDNVRCFDFDQSLSDYQQLRYKQNNSPRENTGIKKSELIPCAVLSRNNSNLDKKIKESKSIIELKDNWDDEGAKKINLKAYNEAISFLSDYSEKVSDLFDKDLIMPSIVPVRDGSVDLEWNLEDSYLLINFTGSKEKIVYYYLALKQNHKITYDANGQIDIRSVSSKFVADLAGLS